MTQQIMRDFGEQEVAPTIKDYDQAQKGHKGLDHRFGHSLYTKL